MQAGDQPAAETLLSSFRTIDPSERGRHALVLDYWLSIRGEREFPPLHDLDPLAISDAGPSSMLLELIGGGEDAEIRHLGENLKSQVNAERVADAPRPSILSSIAKKLSIVAISRNFLAFEDEFTTGGTTTRCWVTLLPLSASGVWVDYVYALVSFDSAPAKTAAAPKPAAKKSAAPEPEQDPIEPAAAEETRVAVAEQDIETASDEELPPPADDDAHAPEPAAPAKPSFSKLFDSLASLGGFYGTQVVKVEPKLPPAAEAELEEASSDHETAEETRVDELAAAEESIADALEQDAEPEALELVDEVPADEAVDAQPEPEELDDDSAIEPADAEVAARTNPSPEPEPSPEPDCATEGTLQSKLTQVRADADEARQAKLRANAALYEALSAAYDFALDAEDAPEEYLRLVEAQGLKIQLRQPMKPVVRLAFDGMCDDGTLKQLEAVLDWAFKQDLPRGTLVERIEEAGGIAHVLNGQAKAA
jgi:hypothetical protein